MDGEPLLVVAGSIHYDHLLRLPRLPAANDRLSAVESALAPGGMGGNVAAIAGRLGARVRFAGSFAEDDDGGTLRGDLVRDGVDVRFAGRHAGPSWRGFVMVGADGDRAIVSGNSPAGELDRAPGQWPGQTTRREPRRAAPEYVAVFAAPFQTPGLFDDDVAGLICPGSFAPLLVPFAPDTVPLFMDVETGHFDAVPDDEVVAMLRRTVVVFVNEGNARGLADRLTGGSVATLAELAGDVLVVTLGAAGCRVHQDGRIWVVPGIAVDVVDTTGSGDAFAAAFTVAWLRGLEPERSGAFANLVAGLSTRRLGSRCGVPERAAVEAAWEMPALSSLTGT